MQKFVNFIEQHVQWLAIALGAAFLLWITWSNVVQSPLVVKVGGKPVDPGEVEKTIVNGPIAELSAAMTKNNDPITIPVPDVIASWNKQADEQEARSGPLKIVVDWNPHQMDQIDNPGSVGQDVLAKLQFDKLPALPAPLPVAVKAYRTAVVYSDPKAAAAAPGNDPNAQATPISRDIDATSVAFKVQMSSLEAEFKKAFANVKGVKPQMEQQLMQTMFLQVTLYRQEQDANGWSQKLTVVPPLAIHEMMEYPGDKAGTAAGLTYEAWASSHAADIIQPSFYPTAPGAPIWTLPDQATAPAPGTPVGLPPAPQPFRAGPNGIQPQPGYNPGRSGGVAPNPYSNGYRPNQSPQGIPTVPTPYGAGNGYSGPGGGAYSGAAGGNTGGYQPPSNGYGGNNGYGGTAPNPYSNGYSQQPGYTQPGNGYPQSGYPQQAASGQPLPGMFAVAVPPAAPGTAVAAAKPSDIMIYAHDDQVEAGKTYRYFLQYRLLSPLFDSRAATPEVRKVFGLASPAPDPAAPKTGAQPTDKITIPSRTQIYVKSVRPSEVHFAVFVWKPNPKETEVAASPGDQVGPTPWTVVDIRQNPTAHNDYYILLVDDKGTVIRHDFRKDLDDPKLKELHDQAAASATASASSAGDSRTAARPFGSN